MNGVKPSPANEQREHLNSPEEHEPYEDPTQLPERSSPPYEGGVGGGSSGTPTRATNRRAISLSQACNLYGYRAVDRPYGTLRIEPARRARARTEGRNGGPTPDTRLPTPSPFAAGGRLREQR